jgi:hypothetical protein
VKKTKTDTAAGAIGVTETRSLADALSLAETELPAAPLDRMRALRPVLRWLRAQVQALPHEQPNYLVATELTALREAAEKVRSAKQTIAAARTAADDALRECEDLAAQDANDDDLRGANEKLLRAECDVRMAQQRYKVALQRQDGCYQNAFVAGERAREDDRTAVTVFGNELERPSQFTQPPADDRPLGHLAFDLADECEGYASYCRRRAIDADIWRSNLKRRLRDVMEPPLPEPQPAAEPRDMLPGIQTVIEIFGNDAPEFPRGELPARDASTIAQAM